MMLVDHRHIDPTPIASSPLSSPNSQSRKRKRSIQHPKFLPLSQWRTPKQHQIYSSKLISAICRVRRSPSTRSAVRSAADRALAAAARGRSRWSRAILSSRGVNVKARSPRVSMPRRAKKSPPTRSAAAAAIEAKAMVLGRLVPGCRKLPMPSLLDETADYIAALEVQVRAMSVLVDMLSYGFGSQAVPS